MLSVMEDIYEKLTNGLQIKLETEDGTLTINPQEANLIWISKDKKNIVVTYANYHVHIHEQNGKMIWDFEFHSELVQRILYESEHSYEDSEHEHEFEEE